MAYKTDETVCIETRNGELELELSVTWQNAEPDVGISQDYIDDWKVTFVNGSTRHAKWVDKILGKDHISRQEVDEMIYANN